MINKDLYKVLNSIDEMVKSDNPRQVFEKYKTLYIHGLDSSINQKKIEIIQYHSETVYLNINYYEEKNTYMTRTSPRTIRIQPTRTCMKTFCHGTFPSIATIIRCWISHSIGCWHG